MAVRNFSLEHTMLYSFFVTGFEKKWYFFKMTQLVKVAIIPVLIELENSFSVHLKANEMQFPMMYHVPRFNIGQLQGHQR
jgi:hypothetical protein